MSKQVTEFEANGAKKPVQVVYQFDLGGKAQTLDFGMYCWELFCEKMNVGPNSLMVAFQGTSTFKAIRALTFCAIIANDFINGRPDSISENDAAIWLNNSPEVAEDIFQTALGVYYGVLRTGNEIIDITKSE